MTRYSLKRQNKRLKAWLTFLVALAFVLVITLTIATKDIAHRTGEAQQYDWACLEEPHQNPLKECKK